MDFDLQKIMKSGQVFRMTKEGEAYQIISSDKLLRLSSIEDVPDGYWHNYFDLERDYAAIRNAACGKYPFIDECMQFGEGLRILRQDPWEMVITFIISQRRSMTSIATCVERLCQKFGTKLSVEVNGEPVNYHAFPTPEQLCEASEAAIQSCGVGYRASYIKDAAAKIASGEINLSRCQTWTDAELKNELLSIKGVGEKVANCIMLFGFARTSCAPIDVWIDRVIKNDLEGHNPFPEYGDVAGIIQQYLFFYKTQTK